jgi:hypothetical protein
LGHELEHLAFSWRERVEGPVRRLVASGRRRAWGRGKAADDQLAAYTDVPADQKHQAVEPVAVCTSGSLTPVRRMTPKRRKRRGESVPSPEQDKAEVVRAVLTRREIGVVNYEAGY